LQFSVEVFGVVIGIFPVAVCFSLAGLDMKTQIVVCVSRAGEVFFITETSCFNGGKVMVVFCPFFRRDNYGARECIVSE